MRFKSAYRKLILIRIGSIMLCVALNGLTYSQPIAQLDSLENSYSLINGWEYQAKMTNLGNPFLISNKWMNGSITSELGVFKNCLFNYDIYQDALVIQRNTDGKIISFVLNPILVKEFKSDAYLFIALNTNKDSCGPATFGYFERINRGSIELLRKWTKTIIDENLIGKSDFKISRSYYLFFEGSLVLIKNRRSVYKLFPSYIKEIRHYYATHSFSFDRAGNPEWVAFAEFLNKLIEKQ
jgi:hypothetical protein